ncbi:glutamate racemase [Candidatus Saganbacteria bacterium]|nr:glutamate racemase [Candidatus Saganbacteria bacterium]
MNSDIQKIKSDKVVSYSKKIEDGSKSEKASPIGVFDSGVGGLSVLSQITRLLPHEDIIYIADTARVPYGGRPDDEIIKINREILDHFEKAKVKAVVMACGTSSSIAYPVLKEKYKFPIISLIRPGAKAALDKTHNQKIGVIATLATINSKAYEGTIHELKDTAKVLSSPCPLFVPMIEGGFIETDETRKIAVEYLKPLLKEGIDTLILGCTHYPHLVKVLSSIAGPNVALVDPSEYAANELMEVLGKHQLLNSKNHKAKYSYLVTGKVEQFLELGNKLFSRPIASAKQIKL